MHHRGETRRPTETHWRALRQTFPGAVNVTVTSRERLGTVDDGARSTPHRDGTGAVVLAVGVEQWETPHRDTDRDVLASVM